MTKRRISTLFVSSALLTTPAARADFMNLEIEQLATVTTAAGAKNVFRIYARFSNGADRVISWSGSVTNPSVIKSGPCASWGLFYQAPLGDNRAPSQDAINRDPDTQWDTFATIGVNIAEQGVPYDQTALSPGFPTFINGNQLTINNATVFVPLTSPQARADFLGDGDSQLRVLLMQLTLSPEDFPYGQVGTITWRNAAGQTFQNTEWNIWLGLAAHGRCCLPTGQCAPVYQSACSVNYNGFFLYCDPCDGCALTCTADVVPHPGDGHVDVNDLLAVISAWGPCSPWDTVPANCSPPFGDNLVDVNDLLTVISAWGPCH